MSIVGKGSCLACGFAMLFIAEETSLAAIYNASDLDASAFGFGADRPPNWPQQDLIVIRYVVSPSEDTYTDAFDPTHTRDYFRELLFGPDPSMTGFLDQMSPNNFRLGDEGNIYVSRNIYSIPKTTSVGMRQDLLRAAAREIDYQRYDDNGDGRIDTHELAIVVIAATSGQSGGNVRNAGCIQASAFGPELCMDIAAFGEWSSLSLVAHEVLHMFKTVDLYGLFASGRCWNSPVSLMGCPWGKTHLDPMHKIRLGWSSPRIFALQEQRYACETLEAQTVDASPRRSAHEPILLYDVQRGSSEFFLFEYRNGNAASVAEEQNYDQGLNQQGVAIWHVATDGRGDIRSLPMFIVPGSGEDTLRSFVPWGSDDIRRTKHDGAPYIEWGIDNKFQTRLRSPDRLHSMPGINLVRAPDGALGQPPAELWRSEHGEIRLRWLDGQDVGIRVRVSPSDEDADQLDILWEVDGSEDPPIADSAFLECYERVTGEDVDVSLSPDDTVLYGIKPDGSLVWYRHLARQTGDSGPGWSQWANGGNERVLAWGSGPGSGWSSFKQVVSGGNGVFYGIKTDGSLIWHRHLSPETGETGTNQWANGGNERVLAVGSGPGSGWSSFKSVHGLTDNL